MTPMIAIVCIAAAYALNAFGVWADWIDTSLRFEYYGQSEGTDFLRDKNTGLISRKRIFIAAVIEIAATAVPIGLWVSGIGPEWCWYTGAGLAAVFGLLHTVTGLNNRKTARDNRLKQIKKRRQIQEYSGPADGLDRVIGSTLYTNNRSGMSYFPLFSWIRVLPASPETARDEVAAEILDWARTPEHLAWPDTRFHPKV